SKGLVATIEAHRVPAHLPQNVNEGTGAAAAAPAVDERAPAARLLREALLDEAGDVVRRERRAGALRLEGRALLVDRADQRALFIVEHRRALRPGQAVLGVLGGTARIEDVVERFQLRERERRAYRRLGAIAVEGKLGHLRAETSGFNAAQTVSATCTSPSAVG